MPLGANYPAGINDPGIGAEAITPGTSLTNVSREIYVGVGGNIVVDFVNGSQVTLTAVPTGSRLPYRITNVVSAGTTASSLVAIY